jgi:hypothetical protein
MAATAIPVDQYELFHTAANDLVSRISVDQGIVPDGGYRSTQLGIRTGVYR